MRRSGPGATGYLGKDMSLARLPRVVEAVLAGEVALPRRYTSHLLEALRGRDARRARVLGRARHFVTDRQWEILELLGEGRSTAENGTQTRDLGGHRAAPHLVRPAQARPSRSRERRRADARPFTRVNGDGPGDRW